MFSNNSTPAKDVVFDVHTIVVGCKFIKSFLMNEFVQFKNSAMLMLLIALFCGVALLLLILHKNYTHLNVNTTFSLASVCDVNSEISLSWTGTNNASQAGITR